MFADPFTSSSGRPLLHLILFILAPIMFKSRRFIDGGGVITIGWMMKTGGSGHSMVIPFCRSLDFRLYDIDVCQQVA